MNGRSKRSKDAGPRSRGNTANLPAKLDPPVGGHRHLGLGGARFTACVLNFQQDSGPHRCCSKTQGRRVHNSVPWSTKSSINSASPRLPAD